jgi:glycerophosphoryl diester phosphodiesterase
MIGVATAALAAASRRGATMYPQRSNAAWLLWVGLTTACVPPHSDMTKTPAFPTLDRHPPLIAAHRGASGYLPEHTLAAYRLAIAQGADFIEPDLVATKDGVLIARHDLNLADTTDVARHPEFADRQTTKRIDGKTEHGWFAEDFTLAEIRTLRARQRFPFRPQELDGRYPIPTLQEVIDLVEAEGRARHRRIGLYPETKHPTHHRTIGLELEPLLVSALEQNGLNRADAPVFIQSFETANLRTLNGMTPVRLIQLIDAIGVAPDGSLDPGQPHDFVVSGDPRTNADLLRPEGLREIAGYADGVSPWKRYIISARSETGHGDDTVSGARHLLPPSQLIANAHAAGLLVHTWTFRNEAHYLAADYHNDPVQEYVQFYCLGIDGVFSDFPDTAVAARARVLRDPELCREERS